MKNISKYMMLLVAATLWQCEPNVDEFSPSKGEADFSNFVAIGDSYTAGYTDGALGKRGQEESFSYILAQQLSYVGSSSYIQPFVKSEGSVGGLVADELGNIIHSNGYFVLGIKDEALVPITDTESDLSILGDRLFDSNKLVQNVGIPGVKAIHLRYPGYGMANPFYTRFASNPVSSTIIDDAMLAKPTFASLWIGNNDVLGYALAGGEKDAITPLTLFKSEMEGIVSSVFADAQGVLGNIPAIDAIPFFNTVPYNALPLDETGAAYLNSQDEIKAYNKGAIALGLDEIVFQEGANALIIADEDYAHPAKIRQIKADEKFLLSLPTSKIKDEGWGTLVPVPAHYVLDATELKAISDATVAYNIVIADLCKNNSLAHVDLYALMNKLDDSGIIIDGNRYTTTFVQGGVFSLDGIHASGRGSAIIANAFIEAINTQYRANIPLANVNDYNMVEFP